MREVESLRDGFVQAEMKMTEPQPIRFNPQVDNIVERQIKLAEFEGDVTNLINHLSIENTCSTPDFIIGKFLRDQLEAFIVATINRTNWYGREGV